MIQVKNLSKTIKGQLILDNINLELEYGRIYGFVGPNGSGKSMLLKSICGFIHPDTGSIVIDGKVLGQDLDFPEDIGIIIDKPAFIPYLSGLENLKILASIRKTITWNQIEEEIKSFGLDPRNKKKVKHYSVGMKQRLAFAQAFMENPKILILDEAMNGLDKEGIRITKKRILQAKQDEKMILLCSHIASDIEELCDIVYEMDAGKLSKLEEVKE